MANYSKVSVTSELSAVGNMNTAVEAPNVVVVEQPRYRSVIHQSELDTEILYKGAVATRPRFIFNWTGLTTTQRGTIRNFWKTTCNGGITPFNWTPPEETTARKLIFVGDFESTLEDAGVCSATVAAEELEN